MYKRVEKGNVAMAEKFDESKVDDEFIRFIKEFREKHYSNIYEKSISSNKNVIVFNNYIEINDFLQFIRSKQKAAQ